MNLRGHGRVAFNWRTLIPICGVVFFFIVSTKRKERMENLKIFALDIRHALIFVVISRLILEKITFNDTAFWPRFRFHGYLREKLPLFFAFELRNSRNSRDKIIR